MTRVAGGLLPYRESPFGLEVFIVHPGGPFFARQEDGVWSIAKGLINDGEAHEAAARREFAEEVGVEAPVGPFLDLGEVKLKSGKIVHVFAFPADHDLAFVESNEFEIEWPKRSGTIRSFPEVDRAAWFDLAQARVKLQAGQHPFLERIVDALGGADRPGTVRAGDINT